MTIQKRYIEIGNVDRLFTEMRKRVNEMLGQPSAVERDETRDENGARVVTLRATDNTRTKDGAG